MDDWDLDTAWAQQEMLKQQMLDDDPGYAEFLRTVANSGIQQTFNT